MSDLETPTLVGGPDLAGTQLHRARLAVARHAHDAADCRELLHMLELLPPTTSGRSRNRNGR